MLETTDQRVLVDPVFDDHYASDTMAFSPARDFVLPHMPRPTAIIVTHGHLDHFHPPTLTQLPHDVPLILPPDTWLTEQCRALGFTHIVPLADWGTFTQGDLSITVTPSDFEWDEFGILFASGGATYWHMSDSVVKREVGERLRREHGRLSAVSARYQPVQVLPGYMRGLGSSFDERDSVVEWLETACATEPYYLFPYSWAVAYVGRHAWANRYLAPWSAADIARIYRRRMPDTTTELVQPGDVLEVEPTRVTRHAAASRWVIARPLVPAPESWEPIDASTLGGVPASDEAELRERFLALCTEELVPLLSQALGLDASMFHNYARWGVVWQCAVHLGPGRRLHYAVDFSQPGQLSHGAAPHPDANFFVHISGDALLRVLRGQGGSELFWMSGDVRQYERILYVSDGRVQAPPVSGWTLADSLPEPLTTYLRKFRPG